MQQLARAIHAGHEAIVLPTQKDASDLFVVSSRALFAHRKLAHTIADGQFHSFRQGARVKEATVGGRNVDAYRPVVGNDVRPRKLGQASAQRSEVPRLDLAQAQQNAGGNAA